MGKRTDECGRMPILEAFEPRLLLSGVNYVVNSLADDGGGDATTLREAIEAANALPGADTITFDQVALSAEVGVPVGDALTITLNGAQLEITDDLNIHGLGDDVLTLDANDQSRLFTVIGSSTFGGDIDVELTGLTLTGGDANGPGSAICVRYSTLTLTNSTISGNSNGSGILADSATLTLMNSTVSGNSAIAGGGIHANYVTLTLINSTVSGNLASQSDGGGIFAHYGALTLINSTVSGNSAPGSYSEGGGIYAYCTTLMLNNSIVALNDAWCAPDIRGQFTANSSLVGVDPGFVRNPSLGVDGVWGGEDDDYGDLRLEATSIAVNRGDDALALDESGNPLATDTDGNPRVAHGQVDLGPFERQGVTPQRESPSTMVTMLTDVVDATDGQISLREAIFYSGDLDQDVTFSAGLSGGTITLNGGELSLYSSVTIHALPVNGITIDAAGANRVMCVSGNETVVSLTGLTLTGGSTRYYGGGIYVYHGPELILTNSTVSGNSVTGDFSEGGGIFANSATLTLTNSTISGNSSVGNGGGIRTAGSTLTLTNSTLSGNLGRSHYSEGGGIYASSYSTLVVTNSTVSGNSAFKNGGGIFSNGVTSTLTLTNSTVSGNSARGSDSEGGGLCGGTLTLMNSIVALNSAQSDPDIHGSFTGYSSLVGVDPGFVRNPSPGVDGAWGSGDDDYGDLRLGGTSIAINLGDDALTLDDSGNPLATDVDGNPRVVHGQVDIGAFERQGVISPLRESPSTLVTGLLDAVDTIDGQISLREAIFYSGYLDEDVTFSADLFGGTITLNGSELTIYKSVAINAASISGMTIDAAGFSRVIDIRGNNIDVNLTDLTLTGGSTPGRGGGIYAEFGGTLTLTNSTLSGNSVTGSDSYGGGIFANGVMLTLMNSMLWGNSADYYGGGIYAHSGTLTLINSTLWGNSADRHGGGIYASYRGTLTLMDSTVSGNSADYYGGGIYADSLGTLTLANSTVSGNSADRDGGGIYVSFTSRTTLTNSTVADNSADDGGGIYAYTGTVILNNSIVALNNASDDPDIYGSYAPENSFIGTRDGDPMLTAMSDSGGTILYYMPLPGSPLINTGGNALAVDPDGSPLVTDQIGNARIVGISVDIGAIEYMRVEISGHHAFYNNSAWDGSDPAAGPADDAAIAADKMVLLPGGLVTPGNYSSYNRGVNGIMVDIDGLVGTPVAGDFGIRVNGAGGADAWSAGPAPTVTVRPGDGVDGSDRVTLIWADGAITNQWVEVTVKSTGNINLPADDVFYFGSVVGEADGDRAVGQGDYDVLTAQFGMRGMGLAADFNGDAVVNLEDLSILQTSEGNTLVLPPVLPGDADGNGVVDGGDCEILTARFGLRGRGLVGDFDGDGRIGLADFAILRENLGNALPAPTAAPEALLSASEADGAAGLDGLAVTGRVTSVNPETATAPETTNPETSVDMLVIPSLTNYISAPAPISGGVPGTTPYRQAAGQYALRPPSEDTGDDGEIGGLLIDLLEAADFSSL